MIEHHFAGHVTFVRSRPTLLASVGIGLLFLQTANDASNEMMANTLLVKPIGNASLARLNCKPIYPSRLMQWLKRIDGECVELLLAETIAAAKTAGLVIRASLAMVIVETTVMHTA